MEDLIRYELFELEVLDRLKRDGLLERLIFGGGTMLRLCHDMQRYSVDLDFWLRPGTRADAYYRRLQRALTQAFEMTDSKQKFFTRLRRKPRASARGGRRSGCRCEAPQERSRAGFGAVPPHGRQTGATGVSPWGSTLLFELHSPGYPRRLKLEIRRRVPRCDTEEKIAFSPHGTTQVLVTGMTLAQMLRNKVEALLDRQEIRDAFDLEFLLRRGVALEASVEQLRRMAQILQRFRPQDYRVTLGSLLEAAARTYYQTHRFAYLAERIQAKLTAS
ncbi:MAG: nucleotidyl transferase AbiEii/AbiGii toxin family protein [Candidatus Omnitrophica bacterium]|nr:nucleotidyl transferase AbiEii/AbiGii toxin family protein [Candidatus Omnitrophota bacterium]